MSELLVWLKLFELLLELSMWLLVLLSMSELLAWLKLLEMLLELSWWLLALSYWWLLVLLGWLKLLETLKNWHHSMHIW